MEVGFVVLADFVGVALEVGAENVARAECKAAAGCWQVEVEQPEALQFSSFQ